MLLLTSDIRVNSEQLQALSSWSSPHQFTSEQQHQQTAPPADSGGFLLAHSSFVLGGEKSDLDGGETNLNGVAVGQGTTETVSDEPTLYGFLFDLFGESLCLRLAGHEALKKKSSSPSLVNEAHQSPQPPSNRDIRHVNQALVHFLSQEGFKPIKVDLPYHLPQSRSLYGERRAWMFGIPRFVLPVQGNALEHGMRMGLMRRQQQHHAHRGRIKTGVSVSYRRRSHKLRHTSDIESSWI